MPLRRFTQAELLLTERKRMEYPLLILVWLGVSAFSLVEGSVFYFLAGSLAVGVNLLAVRSAKELSVRRVFVNVGVLMATAILLLELYAEQTPLLVAMGHYLILIQLCKLFERKTNRDYVQILLLSMLQMVAATLLSVAMWFALVLLTYLALVCHTIMVLTLKRGLDAAAGARLASEPKPMEPQRVAWNVTRAWPGTVLAGRLVRVLLFILLAGVVIFLVTPRDPEGGAPILGRGRGPSLTGFTESVRLGDVDRVYSSDTVMMRVSLDASGEQLAALGGSLYLRGRTFDVYADSDWQARRNGSSPRRLAPPPPTMLRRRDVIEQTIWMDPSLRPAFFALYPPVEVQPYTPRVGSEGLLDRSTDPRSVLWSPRDLTFEIQMQATFGDALIRYEVLSWARPLSEARREWLRAIHDHADDPPPSAFVELPDRVVELARSWCEDLLEARRRSPEQKARYDLLITERIARRLRENYRYTLDLSRSQPRADGVEDFLFNMRAGHCEYFASALTAMACALDVRARLATGFRADLSENGQAIVRSRDAHAWTEVYTPQTDWRTFDATPAAALGPGEGWVARLKDLYTEMQFHWRQSVVGYDALTRRTLLDDGIDWLRLRAREAGGLLTALGRAWRDLLVHGEVDIVLAWFLLGVAGVGAAVWTVLLARRVRREARRRRSVRPAEAAAYRQLRFARKLFALLGRHGVRPLPTRTPRETAARAARELRLPPDTLGELIDLYYRLRWGHQPQDPAEILTAERRVDELAEQLTRSPRHEQPETAPTPR